MVARVRPGGAYAGMGVPAKAPMHMIALEPRIVLDAAAVETAAEFSQQTAHQQFAEDYVAQMLGTGQEPSEVGPPNQSPDQETEQSTGETSPSEVVFISSDIDDIEPYLSNLPDDAEVIILDVTADVFDQMNSALASRGDLNAVHLITHGDEGLLQFGDVTIDADALSQNYQEQLAQIGAALTENGDILIYGCDFGGGDKGREALELLLGADLLS